MNEKLNSSVETDAHVDSSEHAEVTIVQFEPTTEFDARETKIGEQSLMYRGERIKVNEPGEDWL